MTTFFSFPMPKDLPSALEFENKIAGMEPPLPDVRQLKATVELVCDFYGRDVRFTIDALPSGAFLRSERQSNESNVTVLAGRYHNYTQHRADRDEVAYEHFVEAAFRIAGIAFTPSQLARGYDRQASARAAGETTFPDAESRVLLKYLIRIDG